MQQKTSSIFRQFTDLQNKTGYSTPDWKNQTRRHLPILDAIIENIPEPAYLEGTPQLLITSLDYSSYVGRIAIGRVHRGELHEGQDVALCKKDGSISKQRIKELHILKGFWDVPK